MVNLQQEIALHIIDEIVKIVPYLDLEVKQQLKLRDKIEEQLNEYDITSKCTNLVKGDILEKAFVYLSCKKLEGMKKSTRYNYSLLFKKMDGYFSKPLSFITTMDLRMFLAKVYKDNQANSLNDKINKIRAFFGWLQDEGYLTQNPAKNLVPTKVPYRKRSPMPELEMEKLKDACNTIREKTILEVISSSGIRVQEASDALISNIDWQENSLIVIGKGDKERKVFFSTRARMFLMKYIDERQEKGIVNDYLFVASKRPYNKLSCRSIQREIENIADRAKTTVNVFPHILRTNYVCRGINRGVSLPVMQRLVGHSSPSTTNVYLTLDDTNVKHEYKKIAL